MEKLTQEKLKQLLDLEPNEFELESFRKKHGIAGDCSVFYTTISRLCDEKKIKWIGRGRYRKIAQVKPVRVFGQPTRPEIKLNPPVDRETLEPLDFFDDIVVREGDFWVLSGFKNKGKTCLCLNLAASNLNMNPVLMGNEYTIMGENGQYEVSPRLKNRLENMNWVEWVNGDGLEKFKLLPVYNDYSTWVEKGKLNIIDWINLPGEYYMISPVIEEIKHALGNGIAIGVLQKNPGVEHGRGGNPSKDFADVELLLDPYGDDKDAVKLTVETVKESRRSVQGKTFAYRIRKGVEIVDFREIIKCTKCWGKGWINGKPCDNCEKTGYRDKEIITEPMEEVQ